ncbi:MAG: hypothetical protein BroJett025_09270 [Patescibacteria group bacterium]|nr:MAG: hypothetical protein BroJett025_09270 [Patescibacteria group bacterium]
MKKNIVEQESPKNLAEQVYLVRENELVLAEVRKRTNFGIKRLVLGTADPEKVRIIVRKKRSRELKKIERLLSDMSKNLFVIERQAHVVAQELAQFLRIKFPEYDLQIILTGSNTSGGAVLKKELAIEPSKASDFDCAVLVKGIQDPRVRKIDPYLYFEQTKLLNTIANSIESFLSGKGFILCSLIQPSYGHTAPTLQSVEDALNMLTDYFGDKAIEHGIYYFYPTYPLLNWERNTKLIQLALEKLRRNPRLFSAVTMNIQQTFSKKILIKHSHLSGIASSDINSEQHRLSKKTAATITDQVRENRSGKILKEASHIIR